MTQLQEYSTHLCLAFGSEMFPLMCHLVAQRELPTSEPSAWQMCIMRSVVLDLAGIKTHFALVQITAMAQPQEQQVVVLQQPMLRVKVA